MLTSISGVDYPERDERFEIVYDLLNVRSNSRLRTKTPTMASRTRPARLVHRAATSCSPQAFVVVGAREGEGAGFGSRHKPSSRKQRMRRGTAIDAAPRFLSYGRAASWSLLSFCFLCYGEA